MTDKTEIRERERFIAEKLWENQDWLRKHSLGAFRPDEILTVLDAIGYFTQGRATTWICC